MTKNEAIGKIKSTLHFSRAYNGECGHCCRFFGMNCELSNEHIKQIEEPWGYDYIRTETCKALFKDDN